MSKKLIITIIIGIIFVAGGYFLFGDKITKLDEFIWNKSINFFVEKINK